MARIVVGLLFALGVSGFASANGEIFESDLGAFFLHPVTEFNGISFRVVGATLVNQAPILYVVPEIEVADDDPFVDELEVFFSTIHEFVGIELLSGVEPAPIYPDPVDETGCLKLWRKDEEPRQFPVHVATGVSYRHKGRHGSIGARLASRSSLFLLSNNHVLANANMSALGGFVYQQEARIGRLAAVECLSAFQTNYVDLALACTTPECVRPETPGFSFTPDHASPYPSEELLVWSRRSGGERRGTLKSDNGIFVVDLNGYGYRFEDQMVVEDVDPSEPFAVEGDSGAVAANSGYQPVGLFFARLMKSGGRGRYLLNPMGRVMDSARGLLRADAQVESGPGLDPPQDCQADCSAKVAPNPCAKQNKNDAKTRKAIAKVIAGHSYGRDVRIEFREGANAFLVTGSIGVGGPTLRKIASDLTNRFQLDAFGIVAPRTMVEVLDEWREKYPAPVPIPTPID